MPAHDVLFLSVSSALIAAAGLALALVVRPRVTQDLVAAKLCLVPIAVLLPLLGVALATGIDAVIVPLTAAIALCLAAAWTLVPTRGSRFSRFERHFWAYVQHTHEAGRRS